MDLKEALQAFQEIADARDWNSLHTPKNLAIAVVNEASELLHEFNWLSEQDSLDLIHDDEARSRIGAEAADVLLYLLALCNKLNIDIEAAVKSKQAINRQRFTDPN
jgi:NTP pyrophosphatase (non-canonical NTP hydrolase)